MIYNILGIIIGCFVFLNAIFMMVSKKENVVIYAINIFCSIGFIGTGIGGFFVPKNLDYIPVILLLVFALLFLIQYYLFLKKNKESKQHKITSRKK